nr:ulp1 protease family, C-terminal catalytic domain-containing protein [Tanacetum cinerariifolium]
MAQGLISKEKGADPLIVVLGPEHGGRTRMVGDGIEKDEKRDAERDAARDAEVEVKIESVEREACNEGRLQKRRKQSSCESTTIVHQEQLKDVKVPKLCMLFSAYTEDSTPIAHGMVYSIGDGTIHGEPLIPYYMKVLVDTFVAVFGDTKLPISSKADDTITMSKQLVGSFLQWPHCRISRILPALETPMLLEIQQTEAPIAAYVRLTARDDDIADYIFEVPGGMIAGHEDTFHVPISTEDIMNLWNFDGLNSSILLYFEWGLCKMLQSRNDNRCGFLNPYLIKGSLCLQPGSAVTDYLTHSLSVSNYDFMLAPYAQEYDIRLTKALHK